MSSRRELPSKQPDHRVVVGWNNPLMTYFATVTRLQQPDDPVILWLGDTPGQYPRAEGMTGALVPYTDLTLQILAQLAADRHADLDRGPTPLQRAARDLFDPRA
jgi:hypothetical protein